MTTNPTRVVELKLNGTWVNVSNWVDVGPGGAAIVITRGRDNEQSEVEPGVCTFSLVNDDGRFSLDLPTGAHYPHFKKWVEVRVTIKGSRRFTGYVSDVATTLDDDTGLHSHSAITCTDVKGVQAQSPVATSWATELIENLSPLYWWPMTDAEGSTSAAEANGGPALVATLLSGSVSASSLATFGAQGIDALETDTMGHVETSFNGSTVTANAAFVASATLASLPTLSTGITVLCIYAGDGYDPANGPNTIVSPLLEISIAGTSTLRAFTQNTPSNSSVAITENGLGGTPVNVLGLGSGNGNSGLVALTVDSTTVQLLGANGASAATITRTGSSSYNGATLRVGGSSALFGRTTIGHVAILSGKMSEATYADLVAKIAGRGTAPVSTWLARACEAAGYTGSVAATFDRQINRPTLKGSNPAAIGDELAKACGGAWLAARDGTPTWLDPTYCPAWVSVPFEHINPGVTRQPDQSLSYTDVLVDGTPAGSTGGWPASTIDIPALLPDTTRTKFVGWLVGTADVWAEGRLSELTIDLQPLDSSTTDSYLALDIRSRIQLTSAPAQFPTSRLLTIEGETETVTADSWEIKLNTAPDPRFVLGDTVAGVLGSDYRLYWE